MVCRRQVQDKWKDDTAAVARQAITTGTDLFRTLLQRIAIQSSSQKEANEMENVLTLVKFVAKLQSFGDFVGLRCGLFSNELGETLESSWLWILKFKDAASPIAFQPGSDGVRLLAVKFIEALILLYTPDPNGSSQPPPHQAGNAIAKKRPTFYGRILPVLLGLDPSCAVIKGVKVSGAHHALKNAFLACLKCTHPGAAPWRDRLIDALKTTNAGELVEHAISHSAGGPHPAKEEKCLPQTCDSAQFETGRKRHADQEVSNSVEDEDTSGKRSRTLDSPRELANNSLQVKTNLVGNDPSVGLASSPSDGDAGPVEQLVGMFGALVAQGEKAAEPLKILISSISSDLLAEVVMANMRYLPPTRPKADGEEELTVGNNLQVGPLSLLVSNVLSLSSAFPQIASLLTPSQPSTSLDTPNLHWSDEQPTTIVEAAVTSVAVNEVGSSVPSAAVDTPFTSPALLETEMGRIVVPSDMSDVGISESGIPGLDSTVCTDDRQDILDASHLSSTDAPGTNEEQGSSLCDTFSLDYPSSNSMLSARSEAHSPKPTLTDSNLVSSTATSCILPSQNLLPKMSIPSISLTDEQKDHLQKLALVRIIEAYKQITVAGGSHLRFSLLAYLGVEESPFDDSGEIGSVKPEGMVMLTKAAWMWLQGSEG
ncbi:hypothetical protein ACLOJK_025662 [Asimina triloba]